VGQFGITPRVSIDLAQARFGGYMRGKSSQAANISDRAHHRPDENQRSRSVENWRFVKEIVNSHFTHGRVMGSFE
jgi:hypothetical protein